MVEKEEYLVFALLDHVEIAGSETNNYLTET